MTIYIARPFMRVMRNLGLNGDLSAVVMTLWLAIVLLMASAEQPAAAQRPAPTSSAKAAWQAHASILSEGWNTTPAEASRLESGLVSDPHNVAARSRLISYYY